MKRSLENRNLPIISGRGFFRKKLDGKQCFELWLDLGTTVRAASALEREGLLNSKGVPYRQESVGLAAKKYILFNQKWCREQWEKYYGELEDKVWYDYLLRIRHLLGTYSSDTVAKWERDNPDILEYKKSLE